MGLPALDNLVRIGQLKTTPRNALEGKRMLDMARSRLPMVSAPGPVPTLDPGLKKAAEGYGHEAGI